MREWLKKCREAKGFTMNEMAAKLSISESYYCAIENGTRQKKMDLSLVMGLSTILGIPMEAIARHEAEWSALIAS